MKNRAIDNMISMWDGTYMGLNFIKGVECYLYLLEGPRSIIINFDIDEDWVKHCDVIVPKKIIRTIFKMEDLFDIPCLIAVNYNDRQSYVKVMNIYMKMRDLVSDMTSDDDVYIPKEMFSLLIKAAPDESK